MDGELLITMVTSATNAIMTRLQSMSKLMLFSLYHAQYVQLSFFSIRKVDLTLYARSALQLYL